jgi:alcohol dehydrogenase YqhD (iron-dependent ADH family)
MFFSPITYSQPMRDLFDTQAGYCARALQTVMEAGQAVMEHHVDALRTLFATTTVATRQWSNAGVACDWMTPVLHATAHFAPDPEQSGQPVTD